MPTPELEIDVQLHFKDALPEKAWTLYSRLGAIQGVGKLGVIGEDGRYTLRARYGVASEDHTRLIKEISELVPEGNFSMDVVAPAVETVTRISPKPRREKFLRLKTFLRIGQ